MYIHSVSRPWWMEEERFKTRKSGVNQINAKFSISIGKSQENGFKVHSPFRPHHMA